MNRNMVPLFFYTEGLHIMVFGGGNVALRKCKYFEGAHITIISETVSPEIENIAETVIKTRIPEDIESFIDTAEIVIAATDDRELNDRVRDAALYMGIYVNSAHGGGNILIPSILRRDKYVVAVSSEGRVPAFPPYMTKELDGFLSEKYDRMLDLLIELRKISKERIPTQHERRNFLCTVLCDKEISDMVSDGKMNDAKSRALRLGGIE
ncbi:MAG: bifunctional precorrin-2 dehydrogenase/sirohydrochlorin ferrochelatase [Candidatus Methanomethylophilaceae archaeon]